MCIAKNSMVSTLSAWSRVRGSAFRCGWSFVFINETRCRQAIYNTECFRADNVRHHCYYTRQFRCSKRLIYSETIQNS